MVQIQINEQVAEKLAEQARARGLSLTEFLARIAQNGTQTPAMEALNGARDTSIAPSPAEIERRIAAFDALFKSMQAWSEKNLPPGHFVDDSRESIYYGPEDRGE